MPVILTLQTQETLNKLGSKILVANRLVLEDIHRKSLTRTPLGKTSNLRGLVSKTVEGKKGTIIWKVPYASYQERGMRADGSHVVRNYTTPGTGKDFAKTSVAEVVEDIGEYYKRVI